MTLCLSAGQLVTEWSTRSPVKKSIASSYRSKLMSPNWPLCSHHARLPAHQSAISRALSSSPASCTGSQDHPLCPEPGPACHKYAGACSCACHPCPMPMPTMFQMSSVLGEEVPACTCGPVVFSITADPIFSLCRVIFTPVTARIFQA